MINLLIGVAIGILVGVFFASRTLGARHNFKMGDLVIGNYRIEPFIGKVISMGRSESGTPFYFVEGTSGVHSFFDYELTLYYRRVQ